MKSGIYRIINSANGKIYIGSSIDLDRRRKQHFVELLKDEHCNSHLQNAYNKYGKENFTFEILEIITDQDNIKQVLLDREQFYIDTLNPEYNICKIAGAFGIEHTLETKLKISNTLKGVPKSKIHAAHIREAQKGKILSEEHVEKLKIAASKRTDYSELHTSEVSIDGIIYKSIKEASEKLNARYDTIQRRLANPNFPDYFYTDGRITKCAVYIKKGLIFKGKALIIDNIEYESYSVAAKILNIHPDTIKHRVASKNFDNYQFKEQL